jgi:hypothetical protein
VPLQICAEAPPPPWRRTRPTEEEEEAEEEEEDEEDEDDGEEDNGTDVAFMYPPDQLPDAHFARGGQGNWGGPSGDFPHAASEHHIDAKALSPWVD